MALLTAMLSLKTAENTGWFIRRHQGSENPEQNQLEHQS